MAPHNTRAAIGAKRERLMTMDRLTLFGLFAVTAMLVCYALEGRSHWFILAFAGACALGSIYGFCKAPGHSGWSRLFGPGSRCGAGLSGGPPTPSSRSKPSSGGDGLTVLLQAGGKASQRAVLMRGAASDETVSTRDCDALSAWMRMLPLRSWRSTTARGSSVTPMSAATQPIMPSSVPIQTARPRASQIRQGPVRAAAGTCIRCGKPAPSARIRGAGAKRRKACPSPRG